MLRHFSKRGKRAGGIFRAVGSGQRRRSRFYFSGSLTIFVVLPYFLHCYVEPPKQKKRRLQ